MYLSDELFQRSRGGYFGANFRSCDATREINTKITLEWTQKQFVMWVHAFILFLTQNNKSINDDKNDDLYTSSLCLTRSIFILLMTSQSIAEDVTRTKQLWHDHMNSISNSLEINFIHGYIHGRSCENLLYLLFKDEDSHSIPGKVSYGMSLMCS